MVHEAQDLEEKRIQKNAVFIFELEEFPLLPKHDSYQ